MSKIEFSTLLTASGPSGQTMALPVPRDASAALGGRERVPVSGTVNGRPLKAIAMPDGKGGHTIAFGKPLQESTGVRPGDRVRVVLDLGTTEPAVEVPPDLLKAITRHVVARPLWEKLAPSHRRAYVEWVLDAKKPEARVKRIEEAVGRIALGKQHS